MSKSLNIIQTLAKIGKVLSMIAFVACIVGGAMCLLALLALPTVSGLVIGGQDVMELILREAELPAEALAYACVAGLIACAGACIIAWFSNAYFKNELQAGTPFTMDGSKELLRLGILIIAMGVGVSIAEGIVYGVFALNHNLPAGFSVEWSVNIGSGLTCLVASVIFRYGAELREKCQGEQ